MNNVTGTCPVFRSRRDAEITLGIYQQTPILVREGIERRNPWQVSFSQGLFNMASDSDLFRTEKQLRGVGGRLVGNVFTVGDNHFMPLCEAKMLHCFDHRYGTYEGQTKAQANQGTLPRLTSEQHDDPDHVVLPRYWVAESEVDKALTGRWDKGWLLGWRDIARSVDERTVIAAVLPRSAVGHTAPLALPATGEPGCLQANLSSFVLDYCARQKLSGAHLTFSVMAQLPVLPPGAYHAPVPWAPEQELRDWVAERVLELSYTSWDLQPYALDLHDDGPPFRWDQRRRAQIRAEIDAAYLHLYGLQRDEAEHVIDSFFVLRKNEEKLYGEFRTRRLVLAAYDEMAIGRYVSPLDPPPGHGPRHPDRSCS